MATLADAGPNPEPRAEELHPFTRSEIDKLAKELGAVYGPLAILGAETGLRTNEWVAVDAIPPRLDTPLLFPAILGGYIGLDTWRTREWYPALEARRDRQALRPPRARQRGQHPRSAQRQVQAFWRRSGVGRGALTATNRTAIERERRGSNPRMTPRIEIRSDGA